MRALSLVVVRSTLAALVVGAFLGRASTARAQEDEHPSGNAIPSGASGAVIVTKPAEPPPPAPVVTPPKLTHFEPAEYPKEALQAGITAQVILVLDVDASGAVTKATAPAPAGHGFDEAAIAAAARFVFEPAQKDGKPVAARIRYQYNFTLAPPVAPPVHVPQKTLEGRVLSGATNAPVTGARVIVRAPDGTEQTAVTDESGAWSLLDLPPGKYHIVVSSSGYVGQTADEDIVLDKATAITFRLAAESSEVEEEVTVKGQRPPREVTRVTLSAQEMNRIPGTNGDAIRSLQNLPGVARTLTGLLIVRGSAPQDTQIFIDGTAIPYVYHLFGLSSVVPTEILDRLDFYPGNFSAQYGRAMGGVVDVGIRDPKTDGIHAMAQADLIDVRLVVEGPIGKGWSFAAAGRRSWIDVWLKPVLESTGTGVSTAPVYYDYQAMIEKQWSKNESLRFLFFGSDDRLDLVVKTVDASDPSLAGGISSHQQFWRMQGRYRNKISADTELKITAAFGQDGLDFTLGSNFAHLTGDPLSTRIELSERIARGITANVGVDVLVEPYSVDVRFPPPPMSGMPPGGPFLSRPPLDTSSTGVINQPAIYTELEITPWKGGRIVPGVRLDYTSSTDSYDLAPRFVARQDLTTGFPRTTLKGGVGVYFEPPQPQETDKVFGQIGLKSNRSLQYDVGVEQEVTRNIDASVETYYKRLDDLVTTGYLNEGRGTVIGLETLIRYKPSKRFFGWLAYTLSRATRETPPSFIDHLYSFDQTHILTVLGSYKLGRGWEFGARFRLVSGNLYTPNTYGFYDENAGSYLAVPAYPPNGQRLPIFHQLDIRVDKTWKFKHWQLGTYLDLQNVYNRANAEGVSYNFSSTAQTFASGLPFLPSIGLRGEF
jgi:TonB family protein